MPEISEELRKRFRAHADDPGHLEPVVVTLQPGAGTERLQQAGLRIERTMRHRPIVAGKLDAAALDALARLDMVVRVELDSTMRALDE